MQVQINGRRVNVKPTQAIGKGGEADVFRLPGATALKIYKPPTHPDLQGLPDDQEAAKRRIEQHQKKLPAFPRGLPKGVVVPQDLATDSSGRIVGYTMPFLAGAEPLLRYSERSFRQAGVSNDTVVKIFQGLHTTVSGIHTAQVVIGDFNDLNVLVIGADAHIIDADSFQFGSFLCQVFTTKFVDPLLCDPNLTRPVLISPHTSESDWYAFTVMLMQSLLFVGPYGGIYKPKDSSLRIPHNARPLRGITVFDDAVVYPKPAIPLTVLSDDLLQFFHRVFVKKERGEFPLLLLENLRWTTCDACGTEYSRGVCPTCAHVTEVQIKEVTTVRGKVTATRIFQTTGVILFAILQGGKLRWLYHEDGQFKREDETVVTQGNLDPQMRYRIRGDSTLLGKGNTLITLKPGQPSDKLGVETFGTLPMFDANSRSRYWTVSGQLFRDGDLGPVYMGDVLSDQTLFWVGPSFGFGFYRAGNLSRAFVFDAERPGINDTVQIPPIRGQLVDSTCVFTKDTCWFFIATQERGKTGMQCVVVRADGSVEAVSEAEQGDGSWLSDIRGKCALGNSLFVATDEGIVRVEVENGQISQTREFPDSEPFVDSQSHLVVGDRGDLYVIGDKQIQRLRIS